MLLNMLLITALIIFIFILKKRNDEIKKIKEYTLHVKNELIKQKKQQEELTLELTKSNGEFSQILLDSVTGLPGRQIFEDRLLQIMNQSKRYKLTLAVMMMHLNNFNKISEEHGFETGNSILKEIAKRLRGSSRQVDSVAYYSEHFFILLPQLLKPETAAYVAQRVQDVLSEPVIVNDKKFFITANIGIATYPLDGEEVEVIIRNVEQALKLSKEAGMNTYRFYRQETYDMSKRELLLHQSLRSPDLLQNLVIYYLPYVKVTNNQVVCIQAIPYLNHPELGLVSFFEFARIAENCGKILEIGEWVLAQASAQFVKWRAEGFNPDHLAINVTLRQIGNVEFVDKISKVLKQEEMLPEQFIFEVLEDNVSSNSQTLENGFTNLKMLGVKIAVGIFAIGHLASQKITNIPVNYLRIDARLIETMSTQKGNTGILNMIVTLAKNSKINMIAEGVGLEKQKLSLQELGCEVMQGKLFWGPSTAEDVPKTNFLS